MDMKLHIWQYITAVIVVFLIYYLLYKKLGNAHRGRGPFFIGLIILAAINISFLILGSSSEVLLYVNIALYLLFAWHLFAGSSTKRILWACTSSALVMIADMASFALADALYYENLPNITFSGYTQFYISSAFILTAAVLVIITAKAGGRSGKSEYRLSLPQNILVIAITVLCAVMVNVLKEVFSAESQSYLFQINQERNSVISILYAIILSTLYTFILKYARLKQQNYERSTENDRLSFEIKHYQQKELSVKSLRELRHDISTHMHVMKTLALQGKNEELVEYFDSINTKYKKDNTLFSTNNSLLNAMLTSKAAIAIKDNIEIKLTCSTQKDIPLAYPEFCALFGNLLDNAIEGNRKVPAEERYIDLTVGDKGEMVFIRIQNAADGNYLFDDGELRTTKRGPKHGIGLKRVKGIAEKADGFFDINPESDKFTAFVMLPPAMEEKDYD